MLKNEFYVSFSLINNDTIVINKFIEWVCTKLIVRKKSKYKLSDGLSGVSIFLPSSDKQKYRYSYLPLYKKTKLEKLIFTND